MKSSLEEPLKEIPEMFIEIDEVVVIDRQEMGFDF